MKKITLTKNQVAIVSSVDYSRLNAHKWYASWNESTRSFYAMRKVRGIDGKQHTLRMAREILGVTDPKILVDHRNNDTLNCGRRNLRKCNYAQSLRNRRCMRNNVSGFKGIYRRPGSSTYRARIMKDGKEIRIGEFNTLEQAVSAYNKAAVKYHGKFASLNRRDK